MYLGQGQAPKSWDSYDKNEVDTKLALQNGASEITNTPAGNITATTVQNAINELDTEKVSKVTTTDNCIMRADGTDGAVQASSVYIDDSGNVGIGTSSPATTLGKALHIYNSTNDGTANSNSSLKLESVNRNSAILLYGDINTITSFKPNGTVGGTLVMQSSTSTQLFTNSNGLGYGGGSGGTVTQLTSKSTAVTLNKPCGKITMNNATLSAGASAVFVFNNTSISTSDTLKPEIEGFVGYKIDVHYIASGACELKLTNTSASALAEAVRINFTVIKGALA